MAKAPSVESISAELMTLLGTDRQVEPFSRRGLPFDLDTAYHVVTRVRDLRQARGQTPIGRKIGFTNRSIWRASGISAPIWNYIFDATVRLAGSGQGRIALNGMPEPRIEPELVLHLASAPAVGMTTDDLLHCIDWVAPGFEVVYSIFPMWDFAAADAAAAHGVHGALVVGDRLDISGAQSEHARSLSAFSVTLRDDTGVSRSGHARDVLGGPLQALQFLVEELARHPISEPLRAGELVSTGTLTEAMPARPGRTWTVQFDGIALRPLQLHFDDGPAPSRGRSRPGPVPSADRA